MGESWILHNFFNIGFVSTLVVGILEILLRKFFPLGYFRYGIPIFWRNLPLLSPYKPLPLEEFQFEPVDSRPYIEIHPLNEFEYGLWPSKFKPRSRTRLSSYSPLTRGYISFDEQSNRLKFLIYLNWFSLLFLPTWFGAILIMAPWLIKIVFVAAGAFVVFKLYGREQEQYLKIWHHMKDLNI